MIGMAPAQRYHLKEEVKQTFRCISGTVQGMILVKGPFEAYQKFRKLKKNRFTNFRGSWTKEEFIMWRWKASLLIFL